MLEKTGKPLGFSKTVGGARAATGPSPRPLQVEDRAPGEVRRHHQYAYTRPVAGSAHRGMQGRLSVR
jgi:hypothetical protein